MDGRETAEMEKREKMDQPIFDGEGREWSFGRYLAIYTAVFALASALVFLPFLLTGRTFVFRVDGESQYILYLRYMGQYLRESIRNLLSGLAPKMYDFTIGMGDDINAIVRFHPLDFLSVFVPASLSEELYAGILLLRYYLSGLSFSVYALSFGRGKGADDLAQPFQKLSHVNVLSGALVYVFGGYMLIRVMNHPIYASAFIILPMLFLGAEKAARGEGRILFPLTVALGFISNYYFFYICSIALLFYMLRRLPDILPQSQKSVLKVRHESKREIDGKIRAFLYLFFSMLGLYLIGLLCAMVTLLPTMIRYFGSSRTSQTSQTQNFFFYEDFRRYFAWIPNLISPYLSSGNGTALNFAVTVLPALLILFFLLRKQHRVLKGSLLLELFCLLLPLGGYVLAGFNNENNRWVFLIALSLAMTLAVTADLFGRLDRKGCMLMLAATGIYSWCMTLIPSMGIAYGSLFGLFALFVWFKFIVSFIIYGIEFLMALNEIELRHKIAAMQSK